MFSAGIEKVILRMQQSGYHWRLQIWRTGACLCLDSAGYGSVFLAAWRRAVSDLEDVVETEDLEVCSALEPS